MEISVQATILPLVIGFLVGYILKYAIKMVTTLVIMLIVLIGGGLLSISALDYSRFLEIIDGIRKILGVQSILGVLPITSTFFLVGLVVGYLYSR